MSLDSQPVHGGADATGQPAIASDAAAPTHRRCNPGESLHGGPTLPEPAIPPVAYLEVRLGDVRARSGQRLADATLAPSSGHLCRPLAVEPSTSARSKVPVRGSVRG